MAMDAKQQHAPGRTWAVKSVHGLPDEQFWVVMDGDEEVCILPRDTGEAHAALIVRAVNSHDELLQSLRTIVGMFSIGLGIAGLNGSRRMGEIHEVASAAIAKATGQPSTTEAA